jgi:eukaryotic-like serine/threonine-protein kinase
VTENASREGVEPATAGQSAHISTLLAELVRVPDAELGEGWEQWLFVGATIGRFQLVRELGRGGFGIVWEARDRELRRAVAFKAVRAGDRAALREEALAREAEAVAQLAHPNLVTLYDVGRCEHGPYLVLELLRGQPLSERLEQSLPLREILRIAVEIAKGLAHAHAAGVVHRDLKPANVIVCEDGQVKVLDFGLAHAFGRKRISGGTPGFMAPEQWEDAPEDERTDVFALGVLLYRALSGELPFVGKSSESKAARLEVPGLPELGELVGQMLAREPVRRPRDGAAVLEALQRTAALLPRFLDSPTPEPLPPTVARVRRRRGWMLGVLPIAAAALFTSTYLFTRPVPSRAPRERSIAVLPFENLSPDKSDGLFADGIHSEIITQLGKIPGLKVIARSSVLEYRQPTKDLKSIARTLGVATLLEGTVRRAGSRLRISAELLDAASGRQLWAEDYDRSGADSLAAQTEVALEIARALGGQLSEEEMRLLERPPTRDVEAYDAYRRAVAILRKGSLAGDEQWKRADELLEQAIARDPSFALAQAWLALSVVSGAHLGPAYCDRARALAERALALEKDLPEAQAAVGVVRGACTGDFPDAVRELRRAEPGLRNDGYFMTELAQVFWRAGDENVAVEMYKRAFELDPLSFRSAFLLASYAGAIGSFADVARALERASELLPGDLGVAARQAELAALRDGDLAAARKVLDAALLEQGSARFVPYDFECISRWLPERGLKLATQVLAHETHGSVPDPLVLQHWYLLSGRLQFILGHHEESRAAYRHALEELSSQGPYAASRGLAAQWNSNMAVAKAGLGRTDEALDHLRAAAALLHTPRGRDEYLERSAEVAMLTAQPDAAFSALDELIARHRRFTPAILRVDPLYAPLRPDPRFEALREKPEAFQSGVP